jgi:hypothetical protein
MSVIPSHRKRGRLTLEQFKQHKAEGMHVKRMPKLLDVSKNHVQFLSALNQGFFDHVTEANFRSDYLSGMSLFEIAAKYNISKDYIGFLREHLDIPRLGAKFINRKKTEKPLTQRQKELIYGSLMGDCGKMSPSSIKMKQSAKQREYLLWKFAELQEHVSLKSLQDETYYDKRYDAEYTNVRFYTNANTDVETIIRAFYPDGKKVITQAILDELTAFSVAVWYMDDGTTDWGDRFIKKGWNAQPGAKLCTDSFTSDEIDMICDWFSERYNISPKPQKRNKFLRVYFPTTETPKLFDLIRPSIIPSMKYKVMNYE